MLHHISYWMPIFLCVSFKVLFYFISPFESLDPGCFRSFFLPKLPHWNYMRLSNCLSKDLTSKIQLLNIFVWWGSENKNMGTSSMSFFYQFMNHFQPLKWIYGFSEKMISTPIVGLRRFHVALKLAVFCNYVKNSVFGFRQSYISLNWSALLHALSIYKSLIISQEIFY